MLEMPDMWMCERNPAVNKWNKPGRPARWTAGLKAEKGVPMPCGVHFMQSYFPATGPGVTLCCIFSLVIILFLLEC